METMLKYLIPALAAYLLGSIPFGFIIGKIHGKDIRKEGSGNIGSTNVTRVISPAAGKICFALDFLKGAIPPLVMSRLYPEISLPALATGVAAVLGHVFPVYLKFKGGKGVATAAGAVFALVPLPLLISLVIWTATFMICRYVSLASIVATVSVLIMSGICYCMKWQNPWLKVDAPALVCIVLLSALAIFRHRSNIKRLMDGTENRFDKRK